MSYRQAEENEEAEQRFACVSEKFANGDYDEEYSDWLMHENIYPPIDSRYELYKCIIPSQLFNFCLPKATS